MTLKCNYNNSIDVWKFKTTEQKDWLKLYLCTICFNFKHNLQSKLFEFDIQITIQVLFLELSLYKNLDPEINYNNFGSSILKCLQAIKLCVLYHNSVWWLFQVSFHYACTVQKVVINNRLSLDSLTTTRSAINTSVDKVLTQMKCNTTNSYWFCWKKSS